MSAKRFMGPYHATHIANYIRCPYAFRLTQVERLPDTFRHAKAIIGDALHFILEAHHMNRIEGKWKNLGDPDIARPYFLATYEHLVANGNPRYPERTGLPVRYGRLKEKDHEGRTVSRDYSAEEFATLWFEKAVQMLTGYIRADFNREEKGVVETGEVEIGFELVIARDKKRTKDGYRMQGRIDQLRRHYTMETIPRSLYDFDRTTPGAIEELKRRLDERGFLLELSDWKTGKDRPIYPSQADPFVVFRLLYQHRIYALAILEGQIGNLIRDVDGTKVIETLEQPAEIALLPDFITWHWLPGYVGRDRGDRQPQYKNKRFKAGEEPGDLYLPGRAPGDPMDPDPRYSVVMYPEDVEAVRKDIRRVLGAIRLNQFFRAPGAFSCTSCQVTRECRADQETPILDNKMADSLLDSEEEES